MHPVSASFTFSWDIHDSWSETLVGTYYLLNVLSASSGSPNNIEREYISRLIIISSHQLVEIMFFNCAEKYISENKSQLPHNVIKEIENEKSEIGIYDAMRKWPKMLLDKSASFDFSREPLQSQEILRRKRNKTIHYKAESATLPLSSAAFYTAIEAATHIWSIFFPGNNFHYADFVAKSKPKTNEHFAKVFNRETSSNKHQ